ncbi:MAG: type II secretion system protein [Phycisphaerae bacterium]
MSSPASATHRGRGFTLIELLVVIAIIALLVSILLPSISQAKKHAWRVVCQTNHNSLVKSVHMYSIDYDDILPFVNSNKMETNSSKPSFEQPGWLYQYHASDRDKSDVKVEEGLLWPYTQSAEVYRCPQDAPPYDRGPIHQITSYLMNRAVVGGSKSHFPALKLSSFRPDAIIIWEVDEQRGGGWWNDGTNNPGQGITTRHGDVATVSCFGGFTEQMSYDAYWDEVYRKPSRLRCVPQDPDGW